MSSSGSPGNGSWRIAAVAALFGAMSACGGAGSTGRSQGVTAPRWMLTIVAPRHGAQVGDRAEIELALTGLGVALDEPRTFEIGYYLDGELVLHSDELAVALPVPPGAHLLEVSGLDGSGNATDRVVGDRIQIIRMGGAPPPP